MQKKIIQWEMDNYMILLYIMYTWWIMSNLAISQSSYMSIFGFDLFEMCVIDLYWLYTHYIYRHAWQYGSIVI